MNHANLLPADRQAANRHRRARKRWLSINAVYTLGLVIVGASYIATRPTRLETLVDPTRDLATLNTTLVSLRQESARLQAAVKTNANAVERPDFGRLFAAIAKARGDGVTLESVDLAAPKGPGSPRTLALAGIARSHAGVTQFAMRVEAMGVFTAVRIVDVTTQSTGPTEGVGFRLQCPMPPEGN